MSPYLLAMPINEIQLAIKENNKKKIVVPKKKKSDDDSDDDNDNEMVQLSSTVGDNTWDAVVSMNHMTDNLLQKSAPTAPAGPPKPDEKKQKEKELEKKAIEEARSELLKPEAVNNVALQSSTEQTTILKNIPEDVNQKMAEIIDDNNQVAGSTKSEQRASISSQLTQT